MTHKRYSKGEIPCEENPGAILNHAGNVSSFVARNTFLGITIGAASAGAIAAILTFGVIFFGIVWACFAAI